MLYKYFHPERSSVVSDNLVRFSQTPVLNDPFESALLLRIDGHDALTGVLEDLLKKDMKCKGMDCDDPANFNWMRQRLAELNWQVAQKFAPAYLGAKLTAKLASGQGIFSLSRVNDNLLMWAHYSDSHRGFVLGIDESHPFFHSPNALGQPTQPQNVVYSSRRVVNQPGDDRAYSQLMCRKSIDWAYEEEVRVFKNFPPVEAGSEPHPPDKIHLFSLPTECIKQLFIGANAKPEVRERLIELAQNRPVPIDVFESYLSEERFELHFRPIPGTA